MNKYTPSPKTNNTPADHLASAINAYMPELAKALPKHLTADRMARILVTEVRKNPKLAECDKGSFFAAILQCAQLGLEPGSALGHAFLIPRRNKGSMECQLQIGYQGMIDLAERSGKVTLEANLIYENELYDIELGTSPKITHKPCLTGQKGDLVGAYAVARYADGRVKFRFIDREEIEEAKKAGSAGNYGPWSTHYNEMARKTAVRRLFKMLPKSIELAQALQIEEKIELDSYKASNYQFDTGEEYLEASEEETSLIDEDIKADLKARIEDIKGK